MLNPEQKRRHQRKNYGKFSRLWLEKDNDTDDFLCLKTENFSTREFQLGVLRQRFGQAGTRYRSRSKLIFTPYPISPVQSIPRLRCQTESRYVQTVPDGKCLCPDPPRRKVPISRLSCVQNFSCVHRAFKTPYVQTFVRSKSYMTRL